MMKEDFCEICIGFNILRANAVRPFKESRDYHIWGKAATAADIR